LRWIETSFLLYRTHLFNYIHHPVAPDRSLRIDKQMQENTKCSRTRNRDQNKKLHGQKIINNFAPTCPQFLNNISWTDVHLVRILSLQKRPVATQSRFYRMLSLPSSTGLPTTASSYVNRLRAGVLSAIGVPPFHTGGAGLGVILM